MASASQNTFKSRDEYKKAKELEEARKAGTALPAVDEEGNDINPHIPQYIAQAPWYLNPKGPTLKHQRNLLAEQRSFDKLGTWYPRGAEAKTAAATRFRPGACANCGATTHKAKECLERPRKNGAKWTGRDLKPDDVIREVNLDWEGKRDRWNGFNAKDYKDVEKRYAKIEAHRKALRAEKLDRELRDKSKSDQLNGDESEDSGSDDPDADFKQNDAGAVVIQQQGEGNRVIARNLRIREDTAKYLYNLDVNSAYYDPKTRAMRADPNPHINPEDKDYAGDNFVRYTGDVKKLAQMELHAFEAANAGRVLPHLQAEPSRAEALAKQFETKKKALEDKRRADILQRYGGTGYSKPDPAMVGVEQSESYVEYTRDGRLIQGTEVKLPASKYPEDVLERNHTFIWGSYYKGGKWGYACCHSQTRSSYCTGDAGKKAAEQVKETMDKRMKAFEETQAEKVEEHKQAIEDKKRKMKALSTPEEIEADRKRSRIVEEELVRQAREESLAEPDDRKREYNSRLRGNNGEVTEEVLEAYRLRRHIAEDPMAAYLKEST